MKSVNLIAFALVAFSVQAGASSVECSIHNLRVKSLGVLAYEKVSGTEPAPIIGQKLTLAEGATAVGIRSVSSEIELIRGNDRSIELIISRKKDGIEVQ